MSGEGSALYRAHAAAEKLILDSYPNAERGRVGVIGTTLLNEILRIDSLLVSGQIDRDLAWRSFRAAADKAAPKL